MSLDTKQQMFPWLLQNPPTFTNFNRFMSVQRQGMPTWLDKYPFLEKAQSLQNPEQVLFVDVGGGVGHQSVALRQALPGSVKGRIVVQDQEAVFKQALKADGVEHVVHDFFTVQPLKGAQMYYMRNIIHDWTDEDALKILRHVKDSMDEKSVLLIDDKVVPDVGVHPYTVELDMVMMVMLGARERTLKQWKALILDSALELREVRKYAENTGDSIIECVRVLRS